MDNYCINPKYIIRDKPDIRDRFYTISNYQKKIYKISKQISIKNEFNSILDLGCGNAHKLLHFFENFDICGVDIPDTVNLLKKHYPNYLWLIPEEIGIVEKIDLVICADVIEHVLDPDVLINSIIKTSPKCIVISTPDRDYLAKKLKQNSDNGPPKNKFHVREWNLTEFNQYISRHFDILIHNRFKNVGQIGQYIICVPRGASKEIIL